MRNNTNSTLPLVSPVPFAASANQNAQGLLPQQLQLPELRRGDDSSITANENDGDANITDQNDDQQQLATRHNAVSNGPNVEFPGNYICTIMQEPPVHACTFDIPDEDGNLPPLMVFEYSALIRHISTQGRGLRAVRSVKHPICNA